MGGKFPPSWGGNGSVNDGTPRRRRPSWRDPTGEQTPTTRKGRGGGERRHTARSTGLGRRTRHSALSAGRRGGLGYIWRGRHEKHGVAVGTDRPRMLRWDGPCHAAPASSGRKYLGEA
jgi:hypothetical protein